jgi:hypothetical protein
MSWRQTSRVLPHAFRALVALPTTNWRASSCDVRAEDEKHEEPLEDRQDGSIKGNQDIKYLTGDPDI